MVCPKLTVSQIMPYLHVAPETIRRAAGMTVPTMVPKLGSRTDSGGYVPLGDTRSHTYLDYLSPGQYENHAKSSMPVKARKRIWGLLSVLICTDTPDDDSPETQMSVVGHP